jgi:NADH-quinone oxidoreductase subunit B
MTEPKWVIAFGVCASTGGFYDNYATVPGIDHIIPVDVYIPGCPPRPEAVLDAILMLQDQIQHEPTRVASEATQIPVEERVVDEGPTEEAGW